jgi:hypothetical protein
VSARSRAAAPARRLFLRSSCGVCVGCGELCQGAQACARPGSRRSCARLCCVRSMAAVAATKPASTLWGGQEDDAGETNEQAQGEEEEEDVDEVAALERMMNEQNAEWQQK